MLWFMGKGVAAGMVCPIGQKLGAITQGSKEERTQYDKSGTVHLGISGNPYLFG